jgi:hypothetical protein
MVSQHSVKAHYIIQGDCCIENVLRKLKVHSSFIVSEQPRGALEPLASSCMQCMANIMDAAMVLLQ